MPPEVEITEVSAYIPIRLEPEREGNVAVELDPQEKDLLTTILQKELVRGLLAKLAA